MASRLVANPLFLQYANIHIEERAAEYQKWLMLVAALTTHFVLFHRAKASWDTLVMGAVSFDKQCKVVDIFLLEIDASRESVTIYFYWVLCLSKKLF